MSDRHPRKLLLRAPPTQWHSATSREGTGSWHRRYWGSWRGVMGAVLLLDQSYAVMQALAEHSMEWFVDTGSRESRQLLRAHLHGRLGAAGVSSPANAAVVQLCLRRRAAAALRVQCPQAALTRQADRGCAAATDPSRVHTAQGAAGAGCVQGCGAAAAVRFRERTYEAASHSGRRGRPGCGH